VSDWIARTTKRYFTNKCKGGYSRSVKWEERDVKLRVRREEKRR
jgi:hypothetical protein